MIIYIFHYNSFLLKTSRLSHGTSTKGNFKSGKGCIRNDKKVFVFTEIYLNNNSPSLFHYQVKDASEYIDAGNQEMVQAIEIQKSIRRKQCFIAIVVLIVLAIIAGLVAAKATGKI